MSEHFKSVSFLLSVLTLAPVLASYEGFLSLYDHLGNQEACGTKGRSLELAQPSASCRVSCF